MSEYACAGVDYGKIEPFKKAMIDVARQTATFPNRRDVYIATRLLGKHGGVYAYRGNKPHAWCATLEGLGNKSWIAELLRGNPLSGSNYQNIAYDTMMMAFNDCAAQGALPVIALDDVVASDSGWFSDHARSQDFARGILKACRDAGAALVAGESPVYRYLVRPQPPVESAAVFTGSVVGIIAPDTRLITGELLVPDSRIIGIGSSGPHANGISLMIRRVVGDETIKGLPYGFDTRLPSGATIGGAIMTPTVCYVPLVERLLDEGVCVRAIVPGTGSGVAKLAYDTRPYRYCIHSWPDVPEIFLFFRERGVSCEDCLTTFNWGVGYYIFVGKEDVNAVLDCAYATGFSAKEIGVVEEGRRGTFFGPENIVLPPPGG